MVWSKLGDRKTSIFAKLLKFDNFFNICWFWVDLCRNFYMPQNVKIFTKKWENYCKTGLNKRSYNFTQKQRWNKKSEIENIFFMWSGKKIFFFSVGRNFCTNGDFSTLHILIKIWKNGSQSKLHKNFFSPLYFLKIVFGVPLDNNLSSSKKFLDNI